jgi:vesicle-associated membrane protein 4
VSQATTKIEDNIRKATINKAQMQKLEEQTENLAGQSKKFSNQAHVVRKQMWWKDMKMRICIVVGIVILLIVIIVPSGMLAHHPKILTNLTLTRSSCCF